MILRKLLQRCSHSDNVLQQTIPKRKRVAQRQTFTNKQTNIYIYLVVRFPEKQTFVAKAKTLTVYSISVTFYKEIHRKSYQRVFSHLR